MMQKAIQHVIITSLVLFSFPPPIVAQIELSTGFANGLKRAGMTYIIPHDSKYTIAPIIENPHMSYEFAIRSKQSDLEIRYAIRTFESKDKQSMKAMLGAIVLNISGSNIASQKVFDLVTGETRTEPQNVPYTEFKPRAVRTEFNAHWGAITIVSPKEDFAGEYKHCMVVAISRKNKGDAYIFYMYNGEYKKAEIAQVFHNLKFQ